MHLVFGLLLPSPVAHNGTSQRRKERLGNNGHVYEQPMGLKHYNTVTQASQVGFRKFQVLTCVGHDAGICLFRETS